MLDDSNQRTDFIKFVSSLVAVALPILQFFFTLLPAQTTNLFLGRDVFGFVSAATFAFTFIAFIAYKSNPGFQFAFNREKKRQYDNFIQALSQDPAIVNDPTHQPVEPPYTISRINIRSYLIAVLTLGFVAFLSLGLSYQHAKLAPVWAVVAQSVAYIGAIVAAALVLVIYYLDDTAIKDHERRQAGKIQSAISLAIKHNALPGIPGVQFLQSVERNNVYPGEFYVLVKIEHKEYLIVTDYNAQVLNRVDESTRSAE